MRQQATLRCADTTAGVLGPDNAVYIRQGLDHETAAVRNPLSYFTRKLRVLMSELGVEFDFVRAPGVLATNAATYGDNPLLRVPTLVYGSDTVIESDHIARYLVYQFDPTDRLRVCSETVPDLNRLAVVNGVMDSEVVLILAKRGGLMDLEGVVYFRKLMLAMENGLAMARPTHGTRCGNFRLRRHLLDLFVATPSALPKCPGPRTLPTHLGPGRTLRRSTVDCQ